MKNIKSVLYRIVRMLGLRITRNDEGLLLGRDFRNIDCAITIKSFLKHGYPSVIYDIGANDGTWASTLFRYADRIQSIVLFEPQKKYLEVLKELDLGKVNKIILPYGLSNEESRLKIKGGNASASFLDLNKEFNLAEVEDQEEYAEVKVLDLIASEMNLPVPDLIKIDVQGFELKVMQGACNLLSKSKFLILELSFDEFYFGQEPLSKIMGFLEENDYVLIDTGFQWRDYKANKRLLQMDGIFANKKNVSI